ncbi:Phage-related lysozyme (muraminidase) [Raoultella terrigena]|nr:Phage-related lysozyme (muraminidase) [Raoultella terrigena]
MWDVQKAVQHLNEHAEAASKGYCARYVKAAISAGGDISSWPSIVSAKDYGPALIERGFKVIPTDNFVAGDVVIIQGFNKADFPAGEIKKDHPHGHMAMFNGKLWVSDFKQNNGYYPGGDYRKAKPIFVFYRHKDVDAQSSGKSAASDNKPMKTCFPSCKQNGKQYATLDEMMGLIGREPHGSWMAGTNRMWHGGIHLTEISAPGSVLKPDSMDSVVPVQCMADGEVVAWRLNQDYKKDTYNHQALQYSTTFVLVKSVCKPDLKKENTWLEFYSLYMGLAPLSEFPEIPCCRVTDKGDGLRKRQYSGTELEGQKAPASDDGKLKKGTRVAVTKQTSFELDSKLQPFGLAKVLNGKGEPTGKPFWVSLDPSYMEQEGTQRAYLPAWMQQAVAKGVFDAVTKPDATLKINAGDAIGFLGDDIVPVGMGKISGSKYVHIEVLSADSRMPAFLDNPGAVTSGRKYIRIKPDSKLYTNSGNSFTQTSSVVGKDVHAVLPEDKCNAKESGGKKYFQITEQGWLSQDDVEELNQFDLKKLGFSAFAQESTPDMSKSLTEKWVQSTFEAYSEQVVPERGIQQQQMSGFYKAMADKLDSNQDGELSGTELYNAVHHAEMGIRDIAARMTVKHVSEWFGGSGDPKWAKFFETYDPIRIGFTKKWLDDVEWMGQVEPFTSGKAVWHMHPVVFLDALNKFNNALKGKLTYDAEGNNTLGSQFYSRVIHWPGNAESGVTLGRGYDMGSRSEVAIYNDMVAAGIDDETAKKITLARGYKGTAARDFVSNNKSDIGEITEEQQVNLFNIIYPGYVTRAIANYNSWVSEVATAKKWEQLDEPIQEVLVDFVYQGFTKGPNPMLAGANNDKQELINYIRNTPGISQYEPGRHRAYYLERN